MTRMQQIGIIGLCVAVAAGIAIPAFMQRASAQAAGKTRAPEDILKEESALDDKITAIMPSPMLLADADFRAGDGQKVIPLLKQTTALTAELIVAAKEIPDLQQDAMTARYDMLAYTVALGDKETLASLEAEAKAGGANAVYAKSSLALGSWLSDGKDAAAQQKVLDDYTPVAKDNPTSDEVASTLGAMANLGAANNDITKNVIAVMRANLKGDQAKQLLASLDSQQAQLALVGKPLLVEGRTSTGGHFSSADYKGKVVVVDFWATWCEPCIAELPNVKKVYADYHDKGMEIVGVSCDSGDAVLNDFTQKNGMTWVQLRETSQTEDDHWSPLAKHWHVDGIPDMFVIDRKGILRAVDARGEELRRVVAQLTAEGNSSPK